MTVEQRPDQSFTAAATGGTGSTFDVLSLLDEGYGSNSRREGGCMSPIPDTDDTTSQAPNGGPRTDSTSQAPNAGPRDSTTGTDAIPPRTQRPEQDLDGPSCRVMRFIENPTPETLPTIAAHFADAINNNFGTTGSYFGTAANQELMNTAMQNIYANLGEAGLQQFAQQLQQGLQWDWRYPMPNFSASVSHNGRGSLAHLSATNDFGHVQTQSTMVASRRPGAFGQGLLQGIHPGMLMPEIIRPR